MRIKEAINWVEERSLKQVELIQTIQAHPNARELFDKLEKKGVLVIFSEYDWEEFKKMLKVG